MIKNVRKELMHSIRPPRVVSVCTLVLCDRELGEAPYIEMDEIPIVSLEPPN
jgi:hypothetical protein